ncbi:MAG: hypothetical protein WCT00_03120 [Bacilli bacterium]
MSKRVMPGFGDMQQMPFSPMFQQQPTPAFFPQGQFEQMSPCCKRPQCPTIYKQCPPICTMSTQVLDQFHITKQPYIHNFHTEVIHHHITENEFIPRFSCSEKHVIGGPRPPFRPFGF